MSKKNRRKTLIKKESVIAKNEFSMDDSKVYIITTIIMFHIMPLVLVMMGESGQLLLLQTFLMMLNPIFISLASLIYGIRKGFNVKMPLFMGIIALASIPMYYQFDGIGYLIQTTIIMGIVYLIFAFAATAIGAFLRKFLNFV